MNSVPDKGIGDQDKALMLHIMATVRSIKHGHVVIIMHNFEVVQIDKTETIGMHRPRECICK